MKKRQIKAVLPAFGVAHVFWWFNFIFFPLVLTYGFQSKLREIVYYLRRNNYKPVYGFKAAQRFSL